MKRISTILMILILLAVLAAGCQKQADPLPMSSGYGCAVYTEQGCSKQVVATGGEIQVESGGTLDLQSGATVDLAGTLANSGGSVTIADNFAVTGTSDLQGNVSDSGGVFTVADNVLVDGAANHPIFSSASGSQAPRKYHFPSIHTSTHAWLSSLCAQRGV